MTETVKAFKLNSGEEIICELRGVDGAMFVIEAPICIEWELNPNGAYNYDLLPWAYSHIITKTLTVPISAVAAGPYDVRPGIIRAYRALIESLIRAEELRVEGERHIKMTMSPRRASTRKG